MNAPLRVLRPVLLLASLLAPTAELAGQTVSGRAVIAAPQSSVRIGDLMERVDGVWAGVALDLHVGRFAISGSATRGQLRPSEAGTLPKRDVGEVSVSGRYELRSWLGFELRYAARAFSSAAGRQRWDMAGVGATASRDLGTPAVRAFASLAYLPVVKVSGQQRPTFALSSDVGIALAPSRFPIAFMVSYRVERFRFPEATARSEQFEAFTLSVGVQARRVAGRWTLGGRGE